MCLDFELLSSVLVALHDTFGILRQKCADKNVHKKISVVIGLNLPLKQMKSSLRLSRAEMENLISTGECICRLV